jgi:hypothetical protein
MEVAAAGSSSGTLSPAASAARAGLVTTGERRREPRPGCSGHPRRPVVHPEELDVDDSGAAAVAASTDGGRRRGEDSFLVFG